MGEDRTAAIRRLETLRLPGYTFDPTTGTVTLAYVLAGGGEELAFTETVTLPVPAHGRVGDPLGRVLELLYVVAGVSYFKVAAPRRVVAERVALGPAARAFVDAVYTDGMAEFAYRNDLPHVWETRIEAAGGADVEAPAVAGGRPLSAVGGGKDSIVTLEALRGAGLEPVPFAVNPNRVIDDVIAASGLAPLGARRRIDRSLFALNEAGAYNGHIPVTAVNSLIAVATAVWHGLGPVVMSNERSASDPNLVWLGHEVNHQWSKGIDAERLLRGALRGHAGLADGYFSLLRPLSELHIAKLFTRFTAYDGVVTSCNAAFKLRGASDRWCGDCPKCRFVFLAMAPFLERARLVGIFGADLLADPAQEPGYLELLGIDGHKPFECVGETAESAVALGLLVDDPAWADASVAHRVWARIPPGQRPGDELVAGILTPAEVGFVPPAYAKALQALDG